MRRSDDRVGEHLRGPIRVEGDGIHGAIGCIAFAGSCGLELPGLRSACVQYLSLLVYFVSRAAKQNARRLKEYSNNFIASFTKVGCKFRGRFSWVCCLGSRPRHPE